VCRREAKIQEETEKRLLLDKWYVKSTHGNIYQHGFPDIFCAHLKYGVRWIEVKNPDGYSFTTSQLENFPLMSAAGVGIWIVTSEYQVPDILFKPPNWWTFFGAFQAGSRRA
jgi:hypothetical protein